MNEYTRSLAHIDIETNPNFIRLRDEAGFATLRQEGIDGFLAIEGLKMAVFADDPNTRKETMDIVVIAPELKKLIADQLSATVFALPQTARAMASRWGINGFPAVALFRGKNYLGAIQGLQTWDDYCVKLLTLAQKTHSAPRTIAIQAETVNDSCC